jgi:hypothetical protein
MLGLFVLGPFWQLFLENAATSWGIPDPSIVPVMPTMTLLVDETPWETESFVTACIGIYTDDYVGHLSPCEEEGKRIYFIDLKAVGWKPELIDSETITGNNITRLIVQRDIATIARFTAKCECDVVEGRFAWRRTEFHPWDECIWQERRRTRHMKVINFAEQTVF